MTPKEAEARRYLDEAWTKMLAVWEADAGKFMEGVRLLKKATFNDATDEDRIRAAAWWGDYFVFELAWLAAAEVLLRGTEREREER